jgi:hypothetical protein
MWLKRHEKIIVRLFVLFFILVVAFYFNDVRTSDSDSMITGFAVENSTEEPLHIQLISPRPGLERERIENFIFEPFENSKCFIYTNYTGNFVKYNSDVMWLGANERVRFNLSLDKEGTYSWNVKCTDFQDERATWAEEENWFFIVKKLNITNNITNNLTNDSIIENITNNIGENVSMQENETNTSIINYSQEPEIDLTADLNASLEEECEGCVFENTCYSYDSKLTIDEELKFCSEKEKEFILLKEIGEECEMNSDCASDYCANSKCYKNNFWTRFLVAFGFA